MNKMCKSTREFSKRFVLIALSILSINITGFSASNENVIKLYKVAYKFNNEFIYDNMSCLVKAQNKHKSSVSMDIWLRQPIRNLSHTYQAYMHTGSQFRPYYPEFSLNYCDLMAKKIVPGKYIKFIFKGLENKTNIWHDCPFTKYIWVRNLWLDVSYIKIPLPLGKYVLVAKYSEGFPKQIVVEISYFVELYYKNEKGRRINIETR